MLIDSYVWFHLQCFSFTFLEQFTEFDTYLFFLGFWPDVSNFYVLIYLICKFSNALIYVLYNWWNLVLSWRLRPEGGGWSTKGCTFISTKNNSTSCFCNHTTNFALLLQISEVQVSSTCNRWKNKINHRDWILHMSLTKNRLMQSQTVLF